MINMKIKIDFTHPNVRSYKLQAIKALKEITGMGLKEAKDTVDSGDYTIVQSKKSEKDVEVEYRTVLNIFEINGIIEPHSFCTLITEKNSVKEIEPDVVKVGSVYIITEEKYQYLRKSLSILMDLLGTSKQFIQAHDALLNK
ncbi:hypothetical protein [uncultured phage cr50_1]|uniref:Large ribosomal subunit protein bL12 C-terminal domain-containing protein n=1 Tax=uncultured phage cr50_1 TaxID=2772059 RepID=A0A7M1RVW0_9CAUD|nr:hypothetical protein KNV26_gp096 [uncultured phage cr50_1]QOR58021.1 hypothetical protein [uncultured phage cr50_1]